MAMGRRVVKISGDLADRIRELLGGQNPTPKRIAALLESAAPRPKALEEPPMPMDPDDIEQGRRPFRPKDLAEALNADSPENLEAAEANLEESRERRTRQARERLSDKIAENEAKGLRKNAPPVEDLPPEMASVIKNLNDEIVDKVVALDAAANPPPQGTPVEVSDDEAIEAMKRGGMQKTRVVSETLERRALQRMPSLTSKKRSLQTLEEAAEVLIAELEPNHQDALRQVCLEHSLATWVVILGAIARMADLQELNAGDFEDRWVNRDSSRIGATPKQQPEVCQLCGQLIPNPRRGQQFCCNKHGSGSPEHTDGCALSHVKMIRGQWQIVPAG